MNGEVAGTGQTVSDLLNAGYTPADILTLDPTADFSTVPTSSTDLIGPLPGPSPSPPVLTAGVSSGNWISGISAIGNAIGSIAGNIRQAVQGQPVALTGSRPPLGALPAQPNTPGSVYYPGYGYYTSPVGNVPIPNSNLFTLLVYVAIGVFLLRLLAR